MKKSELRNLIRQVIKEQADIDLSKLMGKKNFPGSPGGFNPFGDVDIPNAAAQAGGNMNAEAANKALGMPRTLAILSQTLINKGAAKGAVDRAIRQIATQQNVGMNDDIQGIWPVIWLGVRYLVGTRTGQAILYGIGGAVIGSME